MLLTGVTVSDTLTDGNNSNISLTSGPFYSGANQGSGQGTLKAGETSTYRAYYIISDDSSGDAKAEVNRAIATASSPGQSNNVSDTSDDGDDTDGNTVDDPTVIGD